MAKDVPGGTCSTLLIYMAKFHYICLYTIICRTMLRKHLNKLTSCALPNLAFTLTY
jgi:hypothetical protein